MHEQIAPAPEVSLKQVFGQAEKLDKKVRTWAQTLVNCLPKDPPLDQDELDLLNLFLAQQHRLNLEIDAGQTPSHSFVGKIKSIARFVIADPRVAYPTHRIVSARIERDIDDSYESFSRSRNIDPESSLATDWKVSVRFLAQNLHGIASKVDLSKIVSRSHSAYFELALEARDQAVNIAEKRSILAP